jgi:hypothetical protein
MAKKKYMNSVIAMVENATKTMGELLDGALVVGFYGWIIADFSLCKEPGIKKRIGRRVVMYNKAKQRIYIKNFTSCKLNEVCGIYNEVKWYG